MVNRYLNCPNENRTIYLRIHDVKLSLCVCMRVYVCVCVCQWHNDQPLRDMPTLTVYTQTSPSATLKERKESIRFSEDIMDSLCSCLRVCVCTVCVCARAPACLRMCLYVCVCPVCVRARSHLRACVCLCVLIACVRACVRLRMCTTRVSMHAFLCVCARARAPLKPYTRSPVHPSATSICLYVQTSYQWTLLKLSFQLLTGYSPDIATIQKPRRALCSKHDLANSYTGQQQQQQQLEDISSLIIQICGHSKGSNYRRNVNDASWIRYFGYSRLQRPL